MSFGRPLRIAFIAPYPAAALLPPSAVKPKYRSEHPATWVRTLAGALSRRDDVDIRILTDSRAVTRRYEVQDGRATYIFLPKREPIRSDPIHGYRPGAARIRKELTRCPPDVVVGFGIESGCARIAVRQPYLSIVFIQGIIELTAEYRNLSTLRLRAYLKDERRILFDASALIAETTFASNWARRHNPNCTIALIPHAVETAFLQNRPTFRSPTVLCVASLNRIKDPETVIRAFAAVPNQEAKLVMVGDGPLRAEVQGLASSLQIKDRVTFTGQLPQERIRELMTDARLLVLGSRMDTSPNVITEAHAAGLPVVATCTGGIPDMVSDGKDGFLVPVGDASTMADRMRLLLDNPGMAREMGAAGREFVLKKNDPDVVARQHMEFYRQVIQRNEVTCFAKRRVFVRLSNLPLVRRVTGFIPVPVLLGAPYRRWKRLVSLSQFWPREKIEQWQLERFREIVRYAYTHTEGYREIYRKAGVTPEDIRSLADISRLPFVTKEMIRDHLEEFSVNVSGREYCTTGGSTGIPLGFYTSRTIRNIEWAFIHSSWEWAGWKPGMRSAVLRGRYVGSADRIAQYDPLRRELHLSSYFLTAESLTAYLDALRRYRIRVLQAYPSSMNILCQLMLERGLEGSIELDLVLMGSENIYDWLLEKFRSVFPRTRFFGWYGQAEQVTLAPWCEHTTRYHCNPFYGLTEVLDAQGRPVPDGGEGEIVGTSFHNFITPFIRYRTMDLAVRVGVGCPHCKRDFLILDRILGRAHEFIITATGRYISMTAINMHDDIFDGIRQFRFRQERPGHVIFQYVPAEPLGKDRLHHIHAGLAAKLGNDMELELREVAEIPRSRSGKLHFLDQQLPVKYHQAS